MRHFIIITIIILCTGLISGSVQAQDNQDELELLLEVARYDVNLYWESIFEDMKIPYSHPSVLLYAERGVQTRCGYAYEFYGPFYCHLDHGIYIQEWFVEDFSEEVGDFALVLVLAHEWAHAVQGQLGGLHGLTIRIELQADCLAGSYARYVAYESENLRLSRGDIEVGATAFYLAGDSENTEWFDEYAHGTGKQRTDAYFVGLNYGYEECLSRDLVNGGLA